MHVWKVYWNTSLGIIYWNIINYLELFVIRQNF